jgi:outer membrane protein assembly factor BamB
LANGAGVPVVLGEDRVPPFNTIRAVIRSGSAVWLSIGFNGYTREFPAGGNRILALDLCQGKVIWQSADSLSNGGLLLLGDYLVAPYGFTSERRFVFVLDAHSGKVIQKLPVLENVCPSKRWLPHWQPGERCDAPGQLVGAATWPRVDGGYLYVDTNTGSAKFGFLARPSGGHDRGKAVRNAGATE